MIGSRRAITTYEILDCDTNNHALSYLEHV